MKSLFVTVSLITLVLASPLSTAKEDRAADLKGRMQEAQARLNLSDAQIDQMAPIMERAMQAQKDIMARYGMDPEDRNGSGSRPGLREMRAMKQEMAVVRSDTRAALEPILSDAQMAEFQRMQEERKAQMRERVRSSR
jgi:Spy/CpxP family protein refolding chaperone